MLASQLNPLRPNRQKLAEGFEPTTCGLQNRCSTTELREHTVGRDGLTVGIGIRPFKPKSHIGKTRQTLCGSAHFANFSYSRFTSSDQG